jgi:hypothetical protein
VGVGRGDGIGEPGRRRGSRDRHARRGDCLQEQPHRASSAGRAVIPSGNGRMATRGPGGPRPFDVAYRRRRQGGRRPGTDPEPDGQSQRLDRGGRRVRHYSDALRGLPPRKVAVLCQNRGHVRVRKPVSEQFPVPDSFFSRVASIPRTRNGEPLPGDRRYSFGPVTGRYRAPTLKLAYWLDLQRPSIARGTFSPRLKGAVSSTGPPPFLDHQPHSYDASAHPAAFPCPFRLWLRR